MAVYVRFLMGDIIEAQRTRYYWDLGKKNKKFNEGTGGNFDYSLQLTLIHNEMSH